MASLKPFNSAARAEAPTSSEEPSRQLITVPNARRRSSRAVGLRRRPGLLPPPSQGAEVGGQNPERGAQALK